jgi:hypothetical protein
MTWFTRVGRLGVQHNRAGLRARLWLSVLSPAKVGGSDQERPAITARRHYPGRTGTRPVVEWFVERIVERTAARPSSLESLKRLRV